jgi:membrane-associated phospholipid phosphatase
VGGGLALAVHPFDDDIQQEIRENARLEDFFAAGNTYGNFAVQLGGAFGVYVIGRMGGHSHLAILGSDLIRAQLLSQGYTQVIKYAAHRERPDGSDNRSFPSGHAAATFATANVIRRHYGWGWGTLGYGLAAYVASARMAHDRHYLSDVVFGAAVGIAGGRTVTVSHDRNRATITLVPAPGGAAVVVDFN